jgi:hypothetical protein
MQKFARPENIETRLIFGAPENLTARPLKN